jgi:hypothetical protein
MLFIAAVPDMGLNGRLWPLSKCIFATILMHLRETRLRYPQNLALKELIFKGSKVVSLPNFPLGITIEHMILWGKLVRNKFNAENKLIVPVVVVEIMLRSLIVVLVVVLLLVVVLVVVVLVVVVVVFIVPM